MKNQKSSLKEKLIEWAIENNNRKFYDYLISKFHSRKNLLRYYNSIK
jgi:hypothetical protein